MEGLTNAKLKNASCNRLRPTGKPAGLFSFTPPFLPALFLATGAHPIFNEPRAGLPGVMPPRGGGAVGRAGGRALFAA